MSSQHYQQAVLALGALIAAMHQARTAVRDERGADCVMPLPLPSTASDTDHAAGARPQAPSQNPRASR